MKISKQKTSSIGLVVTFCIVCGLFSPNALATWSIVAVDRETGEVGSAGASCTGFVGGIVDGVPGKGILVAQARSNSRARAHGVQMLRDGAAPQAIIDAVTKVSFDPHVQEQQYAVVSLAPDTSAVAFTGTETHGWSGQRTSKDFAVQGNILTGSEVLEAMFSEFEQSVALPLGERLLHALEAGSIAGGDSRCGDQDALSSYLVVAKRGDSRDQPYLSIMVPGQARGGANPVDVLRQRFNRWQSDH